MPNVTPVDEQTSLPRAGFWRRVGSLTLDYFIVTIPLQVLAVVLYAYSDGRIQSSFGGFPFQVCRLLSADDASKLASKLPTTLMPDWNYAQDCSTTLFGLPHARTFVFGKFTQVPGMSTNIWQSYPVNLGSSKPPVDWGWVSSVIFIAYICVALVRFGKTIGMRFTKTRLIATSEPNRRGVALWRILYRSLLVSLPGVPLTIAFTYAATQASSISSVPSYVLVAFGIAIGFWLWILRALILKKDPYYDRVAGTAVIREAVSTRA